MLAEHYPSTFQPQYVDGLLNPSHRTLSFTTIMHEQALIMDDPGFALIVGRHSQNKRHQFNSIKT